MVNFGFAAAVLLEIFRLQAPAVYTELSDKPEIHKGHRIAVTSQPEQGTGRCMMYRAKDDGPFTGGPFHERV